MKRPPADPADDRPVPLATRVSQHALQLWADAGRPEGREADIWLEAERQVIDEDARGHRPDPSPPQARAAGGGNVIPTNPPAARKRRP